MSRPINWQTRYEMALRRLNRLTLKHKRLQADYATLKKKKDPEPLTPRWRRLVTKYLG